MSVAEFKAYERYWDNRRNAASTISTAVIEGEFKGKKEGLKQGREIGRQEGLERGIEISMKKIVKNMLSLGNSIAIIAKVTGLTKAQINALITHSGENSFL